MKTKAKNQFKCFTYSEALSYVDNSLEAEEYDRQARKWANEAVRHLNNEPKSNWSLYALAAVMVAALIYLFTN